VNVADGIVNGTVSSAAATAPEGEAVTLTVTPAAGYALASLTYTPEGGAPVAIPVPDSAYTFVMPAADVTVEATFTEAATVKTASLTLTGQIGLNFRVKIPDAIRTAEGAKAVFVYKGEEKEPIPLNTLTPAGSTTDEYFFSYYVPAKEIANKVGLKLVAGDGTPFPLVNSTGRVYENGLFTYAVTDYCARVPDSDAVKPLTSALQNYGAYTWTHFGSADTQPTPASTVDMSGITADTFLPYKYSATGSVTGLTTRTIFLKLESETTIYLRFALSDGLALTDLTVTGGEVTAADGGFVLEIKNVRAKELDTMQAVTIRHGDETMNISVSALSYATA
jgi:hypothetical protein